MVDMLRPTFHVVGSNGELSIRLRFEQPIKGSAQLTTVYLQLAAQAIPVSVRVRCSGGEWYPQRRRRRSRFVYRPTDPRVRTY